MMTVSFQVSICAFRYIYVVLWSYKKRKLRKKVYKGMWVRRCQAIRDGHGRAVLEGEDACEHNKKIDDVER